MAINLGQMNLDFVIFGAVYGLILRHGSEATISASSAKNLELATDTSGVYL